MLKLILPEEEYWASFQEALEEFKQNPSPYDVNGIKKAYDFKYFAEYKKHCEDRRLGVGLKERWVPATYLWLIEDDEFVGIFDLRHFLTDHLRIEGGHIAYAVKPSARRKGLASSGLKLCLKYAKEIHQIENVLVTCKDDNIASYNTMKKVMIEYGGVELDPVTVNGYQEKRVWIKTKPRLEQIRPLAVAVIKREDKVLAVKGFDDKKNETFYRLIGGGIEFCEKGEETIKREFMEEFGFEPINISYLTTVENIFIFNGHKGHEIILVYEASLPNEFENKDKFPAIEENMQGKYAEFVETNKNYRIYPEIDFVKI